MEVALNAKNEKEVTPKPNGDGVKTISVIENEGCLLIDSVRIN